MLTTYKFRGKQKSVEIYGEPFKAWVYGLMSGDGSPKWLVTIKKLSKVNPCKKGRFKDVIWPPVKIVRYSVSPFSDNFPKEIRDSYRNLPKLPRKKKFYDIEVY